jgi:peptidoglycan pentaglycine glycine transferase (the first glycine)
MKIVRLSEQDQPQYSRFVAAHESGSFLQSYGWGEFQTAQGKSAIRYGVFSEGVDERLVGTVQMLQTKIPRMPGFYLYAPYGPLVAPDLARPLIAQIKMDFSNAWFIRIEPKEELPIDAKPTLHIQPGSSLFSDLSLSHDELLAGMHPKTRYNIKVAAKHGVVVSSTSEPVISALELLAKTSDRQGYKSYSVSYYKQLLEFFSDPKNSAGDCHALLYNATRNGKCIASAIMIDHGAARTYLFGGSDDANRNLMAPYALHWQAIQDAQRAGLTKYDWWGTETASGSTPGFVQFKLRWGGTQKFYAGARDIVLNSRWYFAYGALRKVNRLV